MLVRAVDVDVEISMRPSLVSNQGIDASATFKPEAAASGVQCCQDAQHLRQVRFDGAIDVHGSSLPKRADRAGAALTWYAGKSLRSGR